MALVEPVEPVDPPEAWTLLSSWCVALVPSLLPSSPSCADKNCVRQAQMQANGGGGAGGMPDFGGDDDDEGEDEDDGEMPPLEDAEEPAK